MQNRLFSPLFGFRVKYDLDMFVWGSPGHLSSNKMSPQLFETKEAQCLDGVKWALLKLGVVRRSGWQRAAADFTSNKRLWLHHTVCDGRGAEVRADCQCRCPEGRVDDLLHAGSTDVPRNETELPTTRCHGFNTSPSRKVNLNTDTLTCAWRTRSLQCKRTQKMIS